MPAYGLLTNPSKEILDELRKIYDLGFDYPEVAIEGPEGNPLVINRKKNEMIKLFEKFEEKPIGHTAYWFDLCSDYGYIRDAWILEATREIRIAKELDLELINFHANLNGMFYGEKRIGLLTNLITSLREIVSYAEKLNVRVMLENVPLSNGIHSVREFKYIVDNVPSLLVHLDIAHAFTSGGMNSVFDFITTFREKIVHIHWHDNHGKRDEHLPVGQGTIDHEKVVKALKSVGYDATITLGVFTNSNDAKLSMNELSVLWSKP